LRVLEGTLERGEALGADLLLGVRERVAPVDRVDDAVDGDAGGVAGADRFLLVDAGGAVDFDAQEAEPLDQLELLLDRRLDADHAVLDSLLQLGLRLGGSPGGQRDRPGGGRKELTAVHRSSPGGWAPPTVAAHTSFVLPGIAT